MAELNNKVKIRIDKKKITIIVLNFNGREYLEDCFSSLKKLNYLNFNVIMVDDNSTDTSVSFVAKKFPWVKIIKNTKNIGACASFNQAVKRSTTELILKIDNDVKVDKNWLWEMVKTIKSYSDIGVVGSKILNYDGKSVQEFGGCIDRMGYPINYIGLGVEPKKSSSIMEVFYVSGCSMLFKKKVFEEVGMFDEKFYIYKDDLDLCWRLKLFGYKTVVNLDSIIYHVSGVTQGSYSKGEQVKTYYTTLRKRYFGERNTFRMLLKNYSLGSLFKVLPFYFLIISIEAIFYISKGQLKILRVYIQAFLWNLKILKDTLEERRKIQKRRRVPDCVIMKDMTNGNARWKLFKIIGAPKLNN